MDTRREMLRSQRVCRFCLTREEPLTSIYERSAKTQHTVPLPLQIMACVAIEAFPSDGMPVTICSICRHFMDQSYRFKQICRQADEALRHFISIGELRGPIEWPHDMLKSLPPDKIKIEELEFTDDENEDFEQLEDDEQPIRWLKRKSNMHGSTAPSKIKVVQRGNEIIIQTEEENAEAAETTKESDKETESGLNASKGEEKKVPTFSFPCNICERSFPLKQLLDIHLQKSHRERTFQCNICPNKFFTKYDLQKHLHIHSGEKPYECVVCQKKFARHAMLRRHEKVHSEVPLLMCSQCDSTFFSSEELDAHTAMHQKNRPYKCAQCPKSFTFKQGLLRHETVHLDQHPHKCNYCPKSFRTINMLGRHVQAHAGQRPYPCKYCNRSFLLPHHYTRHLRICHNDESWRNKASAPKGNSSFEPQLIFKCEQCSRTFDKQDELIFHSAIHATENLTCPLCKDKFENVDDVTQHITSHAEGSYVCDWCELMFNSEARLDAHVDEAHGETLRETSGDADEDEVLCIEGRLVDDEMELQLLHENFREDGEEEEDFDEANDGEEYNEYNIKVTGDDEEGQTLEITPQVKREMDIEFRQKEAKSHTENVDKESLDDREDNVIYTELETVDTVKLAQQRQQEQLEAEQAKAETAPSTHTSSILRKAEEIKRQKLTAAEENVQRKVPAKIQPAQNKDAAIIRRLPDLPAARQVIVPKKPPQKQMTDSPRPAPMPVPKANMSGTKSVMQALQKNEEYRALQNSEKRQFEAGDGMAEIKQIKGAKPTDPTAKKLSYMDNKTPSKNEHVEERSRKEIEKDPNIKSNERSLKMLEKDLLDLKKGVKTSLGLPVSKYERFPSRPVVSKDDVDTDRKSFSKKKELEDVPSVHRQHKMSKSSDLEQIEREKRREERRLQKARELKQFEKSRSIDESDYSGSSPEKILERRNPSIDDPNVRRSGRPSKIKDYAKMLRDSTGLSTDCSDIDDIKSDSDSSDGPDYKAPPYLKDSLKNATPMTNRAERRIVASTPVVAKTPERIVAVDKNGAVSTGKRGRGRPRKNPIVIPLPTLDKEEDAASEELQNVESKNSAKSDVIESVPVEKKTEDQPENEPIDAPPVAKKRGRPPLHGPRPLVGRPPGRPPLTNRRTLVGRPQLIKSMVQSAQAFLKRGRGRPSKKAALMRKKIEERLRKAQMREHQMQPEMQPTRKQVHEGLQDESYEELEDVPRRDVPAKRGRKPKPRPDLAASANGGKPPTKYIPDSGDFTAQNALLDETQKTISEIKKTLSVTGKISSASNSEAIKKIVSMERATLISHGEKLISPTGQTLIKVPASVIKSLPPGVKPLPLPPNISKALPAGEVLKTVNAGDVEKMVRGEKKIRKFLMTKADVEAMTKKGLLEIKDGALVVKPGYKLPLPEAKAAVPVAAPSPVAQMTTSQPMRVEPIEETTPTIEEPEPEPAAPPKEPPSEPPPAAEQPSEADTEEPKEAHAEPAPREP